MAANASIPSTVSPSQSAKLGRRHHFTSIDDSDARRRFVKHCVAQRLGNVVHLVHFQPPFRPPPGRPTP
jgi:hypothetical protein